MREILFRGKRVDNGEWEYGQLYSIHKGGKYYETAYYILNIYGEKRLAKDQIDTETIGQYTGLKDKNGKKIFENDILDYWENGKENIKQRLKVFYENGQFVVDHYAINLLNSRNMSSEIIGNIFDNPEIVEEV